MEMNRFIVADSSRCIGCRTCEIACVLAHADDPRISALSAFAFAPRLRMIKSRGVSTVAMCHQCDDAPCLNACPSHAIVYRSASVQIDQELCIGCKTCMLACPFGAMEVVTLPAPQRMAGTVVVRGVKAEAHKCDLCIGHPGGPACVSVCPTAALHIMDEDFLDAILRHRRERSATELRP
jgi:electron transport protein HydN